MEAKNPLLLHHLASKFGKNNEVLLTEALGHVLRTSEPARVALAGLIKQLSDVQLAIDVVENEVSLDALGRCDLRLHDFRNSKTVLVEAKIWAGFNGDQPERYLESLDDEGLLIILVPEKRIESVRRDCNAMAKDRVLDWKIQGIGSTASIGTQQIALISWARLMNSLESAANTSGDSRTSANLYQLQDLVSNFESEAFTPLTAEIIRGQELPRTINSLVLLAKDCVADIGPTGGPGLNQQLGRIFLTKKLKCWLGVELDRWARHGVSPVWLLVWEVFNKDRYTAFQKLVAGRPFMELPTAIENDKRVISFPIDILPGETESKVRESMRRQIKAVDQISSDLPFPDQIWKAKPGEAELGPVEK